MLTGPAGWCERLLKEADPLRFSDPLRALRLSEQAYRRALRLNDPHGVADALSMKALCDFALSNYAEAFRAMRESIRIYRMVGAEQRGADMEYNLGYFHAVLGDYPTAIELYLGSLCTTADQRFRALILTELGRALVSLGDAGRGGALGSQALQLQVNPATDHGVDLVHIGVGEIRLRLGEHTDALEHFRAGYDIASERENLRRMGMALAGIGRLYLIGRETKEAALYLRRGLDLHRSIGYKPGIGELSHALGQVELEQGNLAGAARLLKGSLAIARELGMHPLASESHAGLARAFKRRGDLTKALEHLEQAGQFREQAFPRSALGRVAEAMAQYELSRIGEDAAGVGIRDRSFAGVLEAKEGEITRLSARISAAESLLDSIERELRQGKGAGDDRDLLSRVLQHVRAHRESRGNAGLEVGEAFATEFARKLLARHADLTPTELRICSLLRLNMSTKEIASMLNVSPHNVDMHRWRLRKKLGLKPRATLVAYLGEIGR